MENNIVIRSKIKDFCEGMSVAAELGDTLNNKVIAMLKEATERAKSNGRKTVMPKDL